jgi:hypothetical protein
MSGVAWGLFFGFVCALMTVVINFLWKINGNLEIIIGHLVYIKNTQCMGMSPSDRAKVDDYLESLDK